MTTHRADSIDPVAPSDLYGVCQVCGEPATDYSREVDLDWQRSDRIPPPNPLRAEPCGHNQLRVVVWRGESPTYPTSDRAEQQEAPPPCQTGSDGASRPERGQP